MLWIDYLFTRSVYFRSLVNKGDMLLFGQLMLFVCEANLLDLRYLFKQTVKYNVALTEAQTELNETAVVIFQRWKTAYPNERHIDLLMAHIRQTMPEALGQEPNARANLRMSDSEVRTQNWAKRVFKQLIDDPQLITDAQLACESLANALALITDRKFFNSYLF